MSQESRGVKRKKKSFFQQSVKFHKKGIHGKGVRIDDESYEYFLNVLKLMNQEFESEEDKRVFVENVFHQLEGNEVSYSSNQVVSRVIDNLLPLVSDSTLSHFMETFLENLRPLFMDQFASFVLQKLIVTVTNRFLDKLSADANDPENMEENKHFVWISIVSRYALNNLNEFVFSNYPNRVMRTVVSCLVGHTASSSKDDAVIISNPRTPKGLHKILKEFSDELLQWPRFNELAYNTVSSGFLQILLQCMATFCPKRVKKFGKKILSETFTQKSPEVDQEDKSSQIPSVFQNVSVNRLLEVVMSVAPAKLFTQIYTNYFSTRLPVLACHPTGNFSVQKLIRFCTVKEQFESIFDELSSGFEDILISGRNGVILELCAGCLKHRTKQSVFMMTWMKCMECEDAQSLLAPLTIHMKRRREYDSEQIFNVELHGSLLLQNMLKFNKPIKVISSVLEMKNDALCQVLCNPKGSHIANAMFESEFVGEKSKEKFFKALQGCYSTLAVSKHGSRVFDLVWQWASVKNKSLIASELLDDEAKLSNSPFGRPIIYKVSLGSFRRHKEDWMKAQNQNNKVEKLFADIID